MFSTFLFSFLRLPSVLFNFVILLSPFPLQLFKGGTQLENECHQQIISANQILQFAQW